MKKGNHKHCHQSNRNKWTKIYEAEHPDKIVERHRYEVNSGKLCNYDQYVMIKIFLLYLMGYIDLK